MEQLQHSVSVNALNKLPWKIKAFSSLSVMYTLALCAMHFLRQRSKLSSWMCVKADSK